MKKKVFVSMLVIIFIGLAVHPGCKKSDIVQENPLWGARWVLQSFEYSAQNILLVIRPFSLLFRENGTVDMVVDCNTCIGNYEADNNGSGSLTFIDHTGCTEIFCGEDSVDNEFHAALDSASRYEINGMELKIYFNNGQSRLNFFGQPTTDFPK